MRAGTLSHVGTNPLYSARYDSTLKAQPHKFQPVICENNFSFRETHYTLFKMSTKAQQKAAAEANKTKRGVTDDPLVWIDCEVSSQS